MTTRKYLIAGNVEVMVSITYFDGMWQVLRGGVDGNCGLERFLRTSEYTDANREFKKLCKDTQTMGYCVMEVG